MCVLYTENTTYCYNYTVVIKDRSFYRSGHHYTIQTAHNLCSYTKPKCQGIYKVRQVNSSI